MKNIRERDELKDDSAEFQDWHGQSWQHCPCLGLHSALSPNSGRCRCSGRDADVSARTQLVTATSLRAWALCFSQYHTPRQLPQGVQNSSLSGILLRMSHGAQHEQISTTSNWQVQILGCCRHHPETLSTLTTGFHPPVHGQGEGTTTG